jgi:hypothetical protein
MTVTELLSASSRTPRTLTIANTAIKPVEMSRPRVVSVALWLMSPGHLLLRYVSAASTSMGAIVTACSHDIQAAVKPAIAPNAKCGNRAVPPDTG